MVRDPELLASLCFKRKHLYTTFYETSETANCKMRSTSLTLAFESTTTVMNYKGKKGIHIEKSSFIMQQISVRTKKMRPLWIKVNTGVLGKYTNMWSWQQ